MEKFPVKLATAFHSVLSDESGAAAAAAAYSSVWQYAVQVAAE